MNSAIGLDLGGTKMAMVAHGQALRLPTGPAFTPKALLRAVETHFGRPECIGVAVPGIVDEAGTVVACDVLPHLAGWNVPNAFPWAHVAVCNDVDAARIEETHDLPPDHSAVVVMVGTAVGASLVLGGHPLRGASGWAGEFGYWPIPHNGTYTRLDLVAGGEAIARAVGCAPEDLPERLRAGHPDVIQGVERAAHALGAALAGVLNLVNPHLLVVGGGTWGLLGYEAHARAALEAYALPAALEACTVRAPRAGAWCAAQGALRNALRSWGTRGA